MTHEKCNDIVIMKHNGV